LVTSLFVFVQDENLRVRYSTKKKKFSYSSLDFLDFND
jgi:hypothetical protein